MSVFEALATQSSSASPAVSARTRSPRSSSGTIIARATNIGWFDCPSWFQTSRVKLRGTSSSTPSRPLATTASWCAAATSARAASSFARWARTERSAWATASPGTAKTPAISVASTAVSIIAAHASAGAPERGLGAGLSGRRRVARRRGLRSRAPPAPPRDRVRRAAWARARVDRARRASRGARPRRRRARRHDHAGRRCARGSPRRARRARPPGRARARRSGRRSGGRRARCPAS